MKRNKFFTTIALLLVLLCAGLLTGCSQGTAETMGPLASGGTLYLRVNPEIAISYDENGLVTEVQGRNADGEKLLESFDGYQGQACSLVVGQLVAAIGEAGYFVEEVEGQNRQITIEIEKGSLLPTAAFLDEIVNGVQEYVTAMELNSQIRVEGESDYNIVNDESLQLNDTDYGPNNDGVTDYNDTDYGPNNDGITDYNDTDYGASSGNSNYGDSSYDSDSGYDD